jgi:hypothetical protein
MEFVERVPLNRLQFVQAMTLKEFKQYCSHINNDKALRQVFDQAKEYCRAMAKAKGQMKKLYVFTGESDWDSAATTEEDKGKGSGRLFASGCMQNMPGYLRGFLAGEDTTDVDMANAHPVLLSWICKQNGIDCETLDTYIANREEVLAQFPNRSAAKTLFLKATNSDKRDRKEKNEFFRQYDIEMKRVQKALTSLVKYANVVATVPKTKKYNWTGSAINRILCYYENVALQCMIDYANERGIETMAPMFDGALFYGKHGDDLLRGMEEAIERAMPGLGMRLTIKAHDDRIQMPEGWRPPLELRDDEDLQLRTFAMVAAEFEKTHAKIVNKAVFVKEDDGRIIYMSKQEIKTAYEHMSYERQKEDGKVVRENFMQAWLTNNEGQRRYRDADTYPPGTECPKDVYNLWVAFAMEAVKEWESRPEAEEFILNHLRILCNHDEGAFEYLRDWIAQMIQFPAIKTTCPVLISEEGAGKGTLVHLLKRMLGERKVFETTAPGRDVWGDFNGRMCDAFLVIPNELSKKETLENEGRIKGLITDQSLTINAKGKGQFDIVSYHRFLITTNNRGPMNTHKGDRRNWMVRSSDEKCGDSAYFAKMYELLADVNVVKHMYEYFKGIPGMELFHKRRIPSTEYQSNLAELAKTPVEQWMECFALENEDKVEVVMSGQAALEKFMHWCGENNVEYHTTSQKLGVALATLGIKGIYKGAPTKHGITRRYVIAELKRHFGLA